MEKKKSELMRIRLLERQFKKLEKEANKMHERLKVLEEKDEYRREQERLKDPTDGEHHKQGYLEDALKKVGFPLDELKKYGIEAWEPGV